VMLFYNLNMLKSKVIFVGFSKLAMLWLWDMISSSHLSAKVNTSPIGTPFLLIEIEPSLALCYGEGE